MKTSDYNYYKSGRPVSVNEDHLAFANQRMNDKLRQAEFTHRMKTSTGEPAFSKSKVVWQWAAAVLAWIR